MKFDHWQIGGKVKAIAFTDSFGEHHPEIEGLRITHIEVVRGYCPHIRLSTAYKSGRFAIEGAERFFEPELEEVYPLDRDAYCGECGQIGCCHDGLSREGD